ncbi:RHS repeat-associated core domain-containing protein, partial [Shewanella algae]
TDMLGSVVAESDSAGNIISRSHYEPFGKRLGGDKAGIGYTGHLQDEDLNLTYMQARYYDPLIGRFYSNDPVDFRDVHSFNRYAYANNNPYKYVDPDGKIALILVPPPPPVTGNSQGAGNIKAPNITKQDVINSAAVTSNPAILVATIILTSTGNNDGGQAKPDTLVPGEHAGESIPARGPGRDFTPGERDKINQIGQDTGCHTCGNTDPGTKSGNFVPDHQPPTALNPEGKSQQLYPQCIGCSRTQGGQIRADQIKNN